MVFFPRGTEVTLNQVLKGGLGHLAGSCWWLPPLAKYLHSLRGVSFTDRKSVFIGRNVTIDNRFPELIHIDRDVWLCTGCILLAHSYVSKLQRNMFGMQETMAPLVIEEGVFVGAGSILLPGLRIGQGSYIAAGSVVTNDVPAKTMVGGNPSRVIRELA